MRDFLVIGHRGACGYEPENTLRSFKKALELGCAWIELDVHMADNQLIVIHDEDLSRTTNGIGRVSETAFSYLQSLDAGLGERIPTLSEVLDLIEHRCNINIELKGQGTAIAVSALLQKRLSKHDQFLISSFDQTELVQMDTRYQRGAIFSQRTDSLVTNTLSLSADTLVVEHNLICSSIVDEAHNASLRVLVYTINDSKDIKDMLDLGVDGIFTDFPDRATLLKDNA